MTDNEWVLVPRTVTAEMEAVYANDTGAYPDAQSLHDAMLAAAPSPPTAVDQSELVRFVRLAADNIEQALALKSVDVLTTLEPGDLRQAADALASLNAKAAAPAPAHADDIAVGKFASAMKEKMAAARAKGRGGWDDKAQCTAEALSRMLVDHVAKGDPRDVANFCMMLWNRSESIVAPAPGVGEAVALPIETAPKDGTMVRLLVQFTDHATEDAEGPAWTIGANSFDNTGEDRWQFAGWCWSHDHFTEGKGTPVGWLPMHSAPPAPHGDALTAQERHVIEALLDLAYKAWCLADDSEDMGDSHNVEAADFDALSNALDVLQALPDDQPGYTMGEAAKARWALRRLIGTDAAIAVQAKGGA